MISIFNTTILTDAAIEKIMENLPTIIGGVSVIGSTIYIIISNKLGSNTHSQFNVSPYIQEFSNFKKDITEANNNKNKGLF